MTANIADRSSPRHLLEIERTLDAPVEKLRRCWSEPEVLERWFCLEPWYVTDARIDLRPGGEFSCVMNGPDGQRFGHIGGFLEVEPMRRLVTTDAFLPLRSFALRGLLLAAAVHPPMTRMHVDSVLSVTRIPVIKSEFLPV